MLRRPRPLIDGAISRRFAVISAVSVLTVREHGSAPTPPI